MDNTLKLVKQILKNMDKFKKVMDIDSFIHFFKNYLKYLR
jgi:hypothetical protein